MDLSKEYIKMCNTPEIQKDWKPKLGDVFYVTGDRPGELHVVEQHVVDAMDGTDLTNMYEGYVTVVNFMGRDFKDHFHECRDATVWLPRQDQLQNILIERFTGPHSLLTHFKEFYNSTDSCPDNNATGEGYTPCESCKTEQKVKSKFKTFEQMWLVFYMDEIHDKLWGDNNWSYFTRCGICYKVILEKEFGTPKIWTWADEDAHGVCVLNEAGYYCSCGWYDIESGKCKECGKDLIQLTDERRTEVRKEYNFA